MNAETQRLGDRREEKKQKKEPLDFSAFSSFFLGVLASRRSTYPL
jgi:hypothetical protein